MRTVSGLCLLLALLVACGDEATTIDSGAPETRATTTTTTTTERQDDDDGDDGDDNDGDDGEDGNGGEVETVSCDDVASPEIAGRRHTIELTGDCDTVIVSGSRNAVTIESAERVEVGGLDNDVDIGDANEVQVTGIGHDVRYPESADLDDEGCVRCEVHPA